jgi:alpha-tubulin suppressor-like RCC1 family protein
MATIDLGKIKFVWRGAYSPSTAYEVDDFVSYNGSSYVSKTSALNVPPTDTTVWDLLAQGGDVINNTTTTGDIIVRSGAGLSKITAGAAGTILSSSGAGAIPTYSSALSLVNPTAAVSKLSYPKQNSSVGVDSANALAGNHLVAADGMVKYAGGASNFSGLGLNTAGNAKWETIQLPRGATAFRVIRGYQCTFVISTDGRLFAAGTNTSGILGQGLSNNSLTASSSMTTNLLQFNEVVFPTANYPDLGQQNRPEIVDVWAGNGLASLGSCNDVIYAIDAYGYLWTWGNNNVGQLGVGGTNVAGTNPTSPIRVPYFLQNTVPQNTAILQPTGANNATRIRVRKVMYGGSNSEIFAMVDPNDVSTGQSNLFVWGISAGLAASGTAISTTTSTPTNISKTLLGLGATETVVDFCVTVGVENNLAVGTAWTTPTVHVLTSLGRILAAGKNTNGEGGINSSSTPSITTWTQVTTPAGATSWATPTAWTNPASFTNNAYVGKYTPQTFLDNLETLDEVLVGNSGQRFAKASNEAWYAWGRQLVDYALLGTNEASPTNKIAPTPFFLKDHDNSGVYGNDSSLIYASNLLTSGNSYGFTISKIRTCSAHNLTLATTGQLATCTAIITSNNKYYSISGRNFSGVMGTGDAGVTRLCFTQARMGSATVAGGLVDCRITNTAQQAASTDYSGSLLLNSRNMLYAAGYNGSNNLGILSVGATTSNSTALANQLTFKNVDIY